MKTGMRAAISGCNSLGYFAMSGIISYRMVFMRNRMSVSESGTVRQVFMA